MIRDCDIHPSAKIIEPVNLYECTIGEDAFVGPFVEIGAGVIVGARSRISSHSFICSGVTIGEDVFVAHGVMFTNDKFDSPTIAGWVQRDTVVGDGVRIGSNATILPVVIGHHAIIGAGAVVTKEVRPHAVMAGVPAKIIRWGDR